MESNNWRFYMHQNCIACSSPYAFNINHKQADDGQVWLTKQCHKCKTKWNVHFQENTRELKRLLRIGYKNAAILLNMRGSGNGFEVATEIVERVEKWMEEEKTYNG